MIKDVVVFPETSGEKADEINRGLLAEGGRIASLLGGSLCAISVGRSVKDTEIIREYGVSILYDVKVDDAWLAGNGSEAISWAAAKILRDVPFRLLLFAHSDMGSEVAPAISSHLGTAAVLNCTDIRVKNSRLCYVRPVYDRQFEQEVYFAADFPEIASIGTEGLYRREAAAKSTQVHVLTRVIDIPQDIPDTKSLEIIAPDPKSMDILYARRIIASGYGCRNPSIVEELCGLLNASIAATRPVVDDSLIPKDRMVGQTGKTVSPEFYIAMGISGSPHHVAGIQQSEKIISVNIDPSAPIFNFSDIGFIGDLDSILPKLVDRIKRYRDECLE